MKLEQYVQSFRKLNVNRRDGHASPHQVCMLLAVMKLIESGVISDNRIAFNDELLSAYHEEFIKLQSIKDKPNPQLPYYHLRSSGFWHHKVYGAKQKYYMELENSVSQTRIRETVAYAYLDDELYELLQYSATREVLRYELYENVDVAYREDYQNGQQGWSRLECELVVADYLDMLLKELGSEVFVKAHHRKDLRPYLQGRSEGSVEYKYQNISAILIELGLPYIKGYKPAYNYQKILSDVVIGHVRGRFDKVHKKIEDVIVEAPHQRIKQHWQNILEPAPELQQAHSPANKRSYSPRIYDYSEREANNKSLGLRGEEFVLEFERERLQALGRSDLVQDIEWTSKVKGDGAGYDIRSFDGGTDDMLFIEVKTTNSGKYQPFYITDNEVAFSEECGARYSLYRVFEFREQPKMFRLSGSIRQHVNLYTKQYQARFQ